MRFFILIFLAIAINKCLISSFKLLHRLPLTSVGNLLQCRNRIIVMNSNSVGVTIVAEGNDTNVVYNSSFYFGIDKQIANIALPAFVSLVADPLASMVDALYIGIKYNYETLIVIFLFTSNDFEYRTIGTCRASRNGHFHSCSLFYIETL